MQPNNVFTRFKHGVDPIRCLGIAKRLNFDDIIYMRYSIYFRRKVIFTMEEEGLSIRETAK
ncbi:hypothetical protein [Arsenophonus endosymbiont of Bemisia tabaci]|uniref:hypothetical protein n=1 Tax=Arsenophonus endosymbiont of Bemisia tabaci TaxID=536059 RepID=UPI0015F37A2C|nr:hypothetical protein [Arsenophonus endosymbiont of Bemisia tabaci]